MTNLKLAILLLAFICCVHDVDGACSPANYVPANTTWKITMDLGMKIIYFESYNSISYARTNTGFYNVSRPNWDFSKLFFQVRFDQAAKVKVGPAPKVLGFFNTSTTNVNASHISANYSTNVYGYNITNLTIYSFNVTFSGSACAGFGYNDGSNTNALICPYANTLPSGAVCVGYSYDLPSCNDRNCLTCFGPGHGNCLVCNYGYLQPYNNLCLSTCPQGFQNKPQYSGASWGVCEICPSYPCECTCSNCVNGVCISCAPNTFREPITNQCVSKCPIGYYGDPVLQKCLQCDRSCLACNGSSLNSCYNCSSGYYLQPSSGTCLQSCPLAGYYPNPASNVCSPCASDCSSCVGPLSTQCLACNASYYLQPFSNECKDTCPSGYYPDFSNNVCAACDLGCLTCTESFVCTSCKEGFYLYQSNCIRSCPQSYWNDDLTHECKLCDIACLTCSGSASYCNSCKKGYFLHSNTHSCLAGCPAGYYADLRTSTCNACHPGCAACTGGSNSECTSCNAGYYLQINSTVCLSSCPTKGWADASGNICSPCTSPCLTCAAQICTSCESGYYFNPLTNLCEDTCPDGYYKNSTNNRCHTCNSACATCTGGNHTECNRCSTDYYLQPFSTTCLKTCPIEGYWRDPSNNTCSPCSIKCKSCIGPEALQCTSCGDGTYLQPWSQGCDAFCPMGYFANSTTAACASCDTCSNNTQCVSCFESETGSSFLLSAGGKVGIIVSLSILGAALLVLIICYVVKAMKVKKLMKIRYSGLTNLKDVEYPTTAI